MSSAHPCFWCNDPSHRVDAKGRAVCEICDVLGVPDGMDALAEAREHDREPEFVGACAWLDVQYGTRTSPDDPEWDDPLERRAHVNHARSMGWKPARELS